MEEIAEGIFKVFARTILFIARGVVWLIWELMCEKFLWFLGWPVCKIITFGALPRARIGRSEDEHIVVFIIVVTVGFAYPVALTYYLTEYLSV